MNPWLVCWALPSCFTFLVILRALKNERSAILDTNPWRSIISIALFSIIWLVSLPIALFGLWVDAPESLFGEDYEDHKVYRAWKALNVKYWMSRLTGPIRRAWHNAGLALLETRSFKSKTKGEV